MTPHDFFNGKKVTLMGLGLLGRGVGDARFMAMCGAKVLITDMKTEEQLHDSVAQLEGIEGITFHLEGHREEDFTHTDMVIKSAGVPLASPYIQKAKEANVPVYMSTALAARFARDADATVVGITGTRGKSTVTQMISHTLNSVGRTVLLGGNVRGVSTLELVPKMTVDTFLVLELDSWQLQGFGDLQISPQVSVFTNLMPDHQNYYPDMDTYFADKANIFKYQKEGDVLLCGTGIEAKIQQTHPPVAPRVPKPLVDSWVLKVPGEHNRENASLAREALSALGLSDSDITQSLESFEAVEGRLQLVRELNGVQIYNDNNATTPEATIVALKALAKEKNIILIMGGADKNLDMSKLLYEITKTCKRVILLAGTGTEHVTPFMQDYSIFDSLEGAVREAVQSASQGDIVLFSPAFASFGMFTNEYERNDKLLQIIKNIV